MPKDFHEYRIFLVLKSNHDATHDQTLSIYRKKIDMLFHNFQVLNMCDV